jgi:hypothetical protein
MRQGALARLDVAGVKIKAALYHALGGENPRLSEARQYAAVAKKQSADKYSANVLPVIREIQDSGVKSLLAARGIPTDRGGVWTSYRRILVTEGVRRQRLELAILRARLHR